MGRSITVRSLLLGEGLPKICIPITAGNLQEMQEQLDKLTGAPCDLVEWRADFFAEVEKEEQMQAALQLLRRKIGERPLLFTFRTAEEGGERSLPLEQYEALCVRAAATGLTDLIDVEWNRGRELLGRITGQAQRLGVRVIGSFHDFACTPGQEELLQILCKMQEAGVDITKAAVMPQTEQDVLTLLETTLAMKTTYADRPYITMSMGRLGSVSRLSGSLTGSAVTFATAGRASAPGQLEAAALSQVLPML